MKKIATLVIIILLALPSFTACSPRASGEAAAESLAESPAERNTAESAGFPFEFTALDLNQDEVSHIDLGERDLFFVYFWATW